MRRDHGKEQIRGIGIKNFVLAMFISKYIFLTFIILVKEY